MHPKIAKEFWDKAISEVQKITEISTVS